MVLVSIFLVCRDLSNEPTLDSWNRKLAVLGTLR